MIKHLTPKSEAELAIVKVNERKEIIKFAQKKLSTFKKLPDEVNMDVNLNLRFTIYPIKYDNCFIGELKIVKYRYIYNIGIDKNYCYYSLKLRKTKSNKWRTISIKYHEAKFPKTEL